ncbi:hypothetical protein [Acetobacter malorum]|uniref:hypothetical protein n=1 Tax=Acetobacter malorum TaxID=178901 RepID=UPI001178170E|nr:hypothetical protein [Acetobacter malorum]
MKIIERIPVLPDLIDYWSVYGGWFGLIKSPWVWLSVVLTLIMHDTSVHPDKWLSDVYSIIPSTLGFSISSLAISLAFPSTSVFKYFREGGIKKSLYMDFTASLTHFSIIQIICLLCSFILKYTNFSIFNLGIFCFFSFFMFLYSVISAFGVVMYLFLMARLYNTAPLPKEEDK